MKRTFDHPVLKKEPDCIIINQVQEDIIRAACQHFNITEEILISGTIYLIVYMRWCILYLVNKNTELNDRFMGSRLKLGRNAVNNGIENIEVRKKIYRQTMDDLRKIAEIAGISSI
jgi:hypothetical protein